MASQTTSAPPDPIQITLYQRSGSLSQYQTTCISKHYALNNQILAAFESHYRNGLLQVAYHLGLKFVETGLLEIPKHGYFYSDKWERLRLQSSVDALRVTHLLQEIIARAPQELAHECLRVERLHYLAEEQYENLQDYEKKRKKVEKEINRAYPKFPPAPSVPSQGGKDDDSSFTSTLLACGDSFTSVFCPGSVTTTLSATSTDAVAEFKPAFPKTARGIPSDEEEKTDRLYPREGRQPEEDNTSLYPPGAVKSATSLLDDTDEGYNHSRLLGAHRGRQQDKAASQQGREPAKAPSNSKAHHKHGTSDMGQAVSNYDHRKTTAPQPQKSAAVIRLEEQKSTKPTPINGNIRSRKTRNDHTRPSDPPESKDVMHDDFVMVDPPKYTRSESEYDLQRALFLSGLQVDLPPKYASTKSLGKPLENQSESLTKISEREPFVPPGAKRKNSTVGVSMDALTIFYHEDFDALRNSRCVALSQVPTYQGRIPESTNGCTVIAPLLCIHHFHNDNVIPDQGLPDQTIVDVIDVETPSILPVVRQNLGLVKDAFLIPADAHESLMEQQYMCHEQFLNVCGGNILEEKHLEPMLEILGKAGTKKVAATFFFHEHVITILQLRRKKHVWFDIIDSLPHEETLRRVGETTASEGGSSSDLHSSSQPDGANARADSSSSEFPIFDHIPPTNAVRIRCANVESLKATLLWYACSGFTPENRAYIDTYQWDEMLSDFDPRVFQAFIWTEA